MKRFASSKNKLCIVFFSTLFLTLFQNCAPSFNALKATDPLNSNQSTPVPITNDPVQPISSLRYKTAAGGSSSVCIVTLQNSVQCIGSNQFGGLGNNSASDSAIPVDVAGLTSVKDVSVGFGHACALMLDGKVKC